MKTARHITVLLLYVLVTVGMTVATHFCAGEPVSANLLNGTEHSAPCCCGDQEDMEGCCSTSVSTLRVDDAHASATGFSSAVMQVEHLSPATDLVLPVAPSILPAEVVRPPGTAIPAHLLDCSFLI
jgi:hypothetical protein